MIECPMPQDVLKYKAKMVASFSTRQIIWIAVGLVVGLTCYFSLFKDMNGDAKMYLTTFAVLPELCIGFLRIYDQPFEKIAPVLVRENFLWPSKRYKKVSHPAWEKYKATREWDVNMSEILKSASEEEDSKGKGKKGKKKANSQKKKDKVRQFKATPSKKWVAIH